MTRNVMSSDDPHYESKVESLMRVSKYYEEFVQKHFSDFGCLPNEEHYSTFKAIKKLQIAE
jgi:hypothetical protein